MLKLLIAREFPLGRPLSPILMEPPPAAKIDAAFISCGPDNPLRGAPEDDNGPDVMGPDVISPVAGRTGAWGPDVLSEFDGCNGPETDFADAVNGAPALPSALLPNGPECEPDEDTPVVV